MIQTSVQNPVGAVAGHVGACSWGMRAQVRCMRSQLPVNLTTGGSGTGLCSMIVIHKLGSDGNKPTNTSRNNHHRVGEGVQMSEYRK